MGNIRVDLRKMACEDHSFVENGSALRLKAGLGVSNFETPGFATLMDNSIRGIQQVVSSVPYVQS
jgi:hypothetical protein